MNPMFAHLKARRYHLIGRSGGTQAPYFPSAEAGDARAARNSACRTAWQAAGRGPFSLGRRVRISTASGVITCGSIRAAAGQLAKLRSRGQAYSVALEPLHRYWF